MEKNKKVKHKCHWSKYGFKQFTVPDKESVKIYFEGNIEDIPDEILALAHITRKALQDNNVKFINIWG